MLFRSAIPEGEFRLATLTFDTGATPAQLGQALGIRLVNLNQPGIEVDFDAVALSAVPVPTASAPEPASASGLIVLSLLGLLPSWRRSRNR